MCGICGILNLNKKPASAVELEKMTRAIAHRGPDGQGHFIDGAVGLGHRRLAIIDLTEAGSQPMETGNHRFFIIYNGEIYNFKQIRNKLEKLDYRFRSRTDTEVVLYAYQEWGKACLHQFNGMFAFAIWDNDLKQLFLARDRYGIKPLYYGFFGETFLFASEQKAILAHEKAKKQLDREALIEYFTFQNLFTNKTLLKGVSLFPPGSYSILSLKNPVKGLSIKKYWDFDFHEPAHPLDKNTYISEIRRLFNQAVRRQLVSDVDVGAYLSGGMDSGSITAVAAAHLPHIKSFTCGFDLNSASGLELGFDEREKAEYMSYLFKTEHYEMVLKAGDMERILPSFSFHLEEPRVGQSYPNFYVAQLASKFVKVVLSGSGGDELFGGYPWRYYRAVGSKNFEDYIDKYYQYWQRLIDNRDIKSVFKPIWQDVKHIWTRDIFRDVFQNRMNLPVSAEEYVNLSLYFEAKTFLHGLLIVEDKLSMAHGLETRVPFLDNDFVDFAMSIPVRFKLGNLSEIVRINENEPGKEIKHFNKTRDGKQILREAMAKYIPIEISTGIKKGFSAPDASWFKGESMRYVKQVLFDNNALIYDYLDINSVQSLVQEHLNGKMNRRLFIWSLLNFEWWLKQYIHT